MRGVLLQEPDIFLDVFKIPARHLGQFKAMSALAG
jgi:hypothetical protein